ncbi:NAD-dependent epimerase/dehydratase family protein [Alcanivorax sp. JB21]|uniref:NAD-dependent epimerase/dehydratase family protein n=1 Tax=Alcanivorax limicola TaxID=2874102 RepID=UPI001CC1236E|nr:NAD-dependent epimerase/dehydratase family protein [Alcanivorax limicola]MBZ2189055.1 NAD-dependent epimerase/dehydratase family protein [Alcanivorax limicola]
MAHVLVAGLGDLGTGLARRWLDQGAQVSGIRRRQESPAGVDLYAQDLAADPVLLPPDPVDLLYIIMTPSGRDEAGYHSAYITAPLRLLAALAAQQPLPPVIFVSSTAVYGDQEGWVDEDTPPTPSRFNGRIMLAAEEEISVRGLSTSVRFSGIYGPGRARLLRMVERIAEGEAPPAPVYGNRIHSADCIGLLHHLGQRWLANDAPPAVVIGTDQAPVVNYEVLNWLGEQMGQPLDLAVPENVPGKRLRSQYLAQGHYALTHPDYRSGYGAGDGQESGLA